LSSALAPPHLRITFIAIFLRAMADLQIISREPIHWFQAEEVSMQLGGAVRLG
jgi:hypothetical protein